MTAEQAAVARGVVEKAAKGEMTPEQASDALDKAGVPPVAKEGYMGEAKAAWDKTDRGKADAAKKKKEDEARKGAPPPGQLQAKGDWNWGDLIAGKTYPTALVVTNKCDGQETVTITVNNLPLTAPKTATIPAKKSVQVEMTIAVPPLPEFMIITPDTPPWPGYYDFKGTVTVVHPAKGAPPCMAKTETYNTTGHGHAPPTDTGPSKLARVSDCELHWRLGLAPSALGSTGEGEGEEECLEETRALAGAYRTRVLPPYVAGDMAGWAWLPAVDDIDQMAVAPLFAMKARADAQMAGKAAPASTEPDPETPALLRASIRDIVSRELAPLAAKNPRLGKVPAVTAVRRASSR